MSTVINKLKRLLWYLVYYGGIYDLIRHWNRNRLLVLTYHGVLPVASDHDINRNCVSVDMFKRQISFLRKKYRLLSMQEALDGIAKSKPLPPYSALVTFDDGFRNNYLIAFPVLKAEGVPATVFVTTEMIDKPGTLPWVEEVSARIYWSQGSVLDIRMEEISFHFELGTPSQRQQARVVITNYLKKRGTKEQRCVLEQLREQCPIQRDALPGERFDFLRWEDARDMIMNGVEIGSHTVRHNCLAPLKEKEMQDEIQESKWRIENELNRPCIAFSYPNGAREDFSERDMKAIQSSGYQAAFSQIKGYNSPGSNLYALRRIHVLGGKSDFLTFIATLTGIRSQ